MNRHRLHSPARSTKPYAMFAAAALCLPLVACGGLRDEMLAGLPSQEDVSIDVPAAEGQALSLGETSEFYEITYNVSRTINGGLLGVFDLIEHIVAYPATVSEENRRVWGPSEPRGLERNSFRFTAERVEEGHFLYSLDARPKDATSDDDWQVVFDGEAFAVEGTKGHGTLNLYFDTMHELNGDPLVGTAIVLYDTTLADGRREVDVSFDNFANTNNNDEPTIATYHYGENGDDSGDFEFSFNGDLHANDPEPKPLIETFTINSRWIGTGAGRSDVVISGGEVPGDLETYLPESDATSVKATECWDDNFGLSYADTAPEELRDAVRPLTGDASACPFAEADYPEEVPAS